MGSSPIAGIISKGESLVFNGSSFLLVPVSAVCGHKMDTDLDTPIAVDNWVSTVYDAVLIAIE